MATDDELAQTATAPATPSAIAAPARTALGRYRLEAVLGEGGMGVVHAAFDSELERKVALKVLRHAGSDDARARLLREARALAKLSHPHVITVFDVGSVDGQDFVAMELVDGQTLGEWLKEAPPGWRQIVAAFIAAGKGLAAAHAAGLVHRDFKPSNVLRSRSGKIVVTDFGLARAASVEPGASPAHGSETTTKTGAIVGTPAYMAPEQWAGGEITAATDQFAFCVALWEALAGERPFRGTTIEELRTGVLGGPAQLDDDAIPRPLRAMLRRGLAVDPDQRWPSMDALLDVLERLTHRRRRWIAGVAIAAAASAFAVVALARHRAAPSGDCPPPALSPDVVWSPQRLVALEARSDDAAGLVRRDIESWTALRGRVCAAPPVQRSPKLACLDAVLVRLDAVVGAALADRARIDADALSQGLVDPTMCDRASPPRLTAITPELVNASTLRRHAALGALSLTAEELASIERVTSPCARTIAITARAENLDEREIAVNAGAVLRDAAAIEDAAARCDDDPIKTEVAIGMANLRGPTGLAVAESAAAQFPQDDVMASVEAMRADHAVGDKRWDEAEAAYARAIELAGKRARRRDQLSYVRAEIRGLRKRARDEDITKARELFAKWLPRAAALRRKSMSFEEDWLKLRWETGEVEAADRETEALRARGGITDIEPPFPVSPPMDVSGEVVDANGTPVVGAKVVAAPLLVGDSVSIASPLFSIKRAEATTDGNGKFTLAAARGFVAAQSGASRSIGVPVAQHVHLVVKPTSRLAGTVALAGQAPSRLWIVARNGDTMPLMMAPVLRDGTFSIDGVPRGKIDIGVAPHGTYDLSRAEHLVVSGDTHTGIALAVARNALHIIAKSVDITPPDGALIWLVAKFEPAPHQTLKGLMGKRVLKSGLFAAHVDPAHVPKEVAGKVSADDLFFTVPDRPDGELEACAVGFARQQLAGASSLKEFGTAMGDLEIACTRVAAEQNVVTIELLPLRKLK